METILARTTKKWESRFMHQGDAMPEVARCWFFANEKANEKLRSKSEIAFCCVARVVH